MAIIALVLSTFFKVVGIFGLQFVGLIFYLVFKYHDDSIDWVLNGLSKLRNMKGGKRLFWVYLILFIFTWEAFCL